MFVRVEPTGCHERKGLVQVRFCMYLDEVYRRALIMSAREPIKYPNARARAVVE